VLELDLAKGVIHHVAGSGLKVYRRWRTGPGTRRRTAPKGSAVGPNGNVYIADTENHAIRRIDVKKGPIEWVAGTGQRGDNAASDSMKCQLARPRGIFVASDGTIYIGDTENHRVRIIH
jgi:hypothetical protein